MFLFIHWPKIWNALVTRAPIDQVYKLNKSNYHNLVLRLRHVLHSAIDTMADIREHGGTFPEDVCHSIRTLIE